MSVEADLGALSLLPVLLALVLALTTKEAVFSLLAGFDPMTGLAPDSPG